jgi:hypothetical protein
MPDGPQLSSDLYSAIAKDPERGEVLLLYPEVNSNVDWIDLLAHQQRLGMRILMASDRAQASRSRGLVLRNVIDATRLDEIEATCAKYLLLGRAGLGTGTRRGLQQRFGSPLLSREEGELYLLTPQRRECPGT